MAIVTTDVHARDIIDELCDREVESPADFQWQQQLRYYWANDVDDCVIFHSDAKLPYGYEVMLDHQRQYVQKIPIRYADASA